MRILKFVLLAALAIAVLTFVVMSLWNWLIPTIIGWHSISFVQALGLLVLSKILFGGFRHRGANAHWRRRVQERWDQMTPEEREKFREGMRGRCGHFSTGRGA